MKQALTWFGLGAGLMYYFDPNRGRSRRARMRDWIKHQLREIDGAVEVTAHDLANRTQGLIARTRAVLGHNHQQAPDDVIVARVRSKLGRVVSHPHAIAVTALRGHVELSGPVLAAEMSRLLSAVASVRGVTGVGHRLQICREPGGHPALQGGRLRTGEQPEFWQRNWSPTMRLIAGSAIAIPALGLAARRGPAGLALGTLGLGFLVKKWAQGRGHPPARRSPQMARPAWATGAPVHDVTIPIHRPPYKGPEVGL
jgi:hypothetical protein